MKKFRVLLMILVLTVSATLVSAAGDYALNKGDKLEFTDSNKEKHVLEVISILESSFSYKLDGEIGEIELGRILSVRNTDVEILVSSVVQTDSEKNDGIVELEVSGTFAEVRKNDESPEDDVEENGNNDSEEANDSDNNEERDKVKEIITDRCELIKERIERLKNSDLPELRKEALVKELEENLEKCKAVRSLSSGEKNIFRCGVLGEEVSQLANKLKNATEEERKIIIDQIHDLKEQHRECVQDNVPINIVKKVITKVNLTINSCEESKDLEEAIRALKERLSQTEDGELKLEIEKRVRFLANNLEKTKERCENKIFVKEKTCETLIRLKVNYDELTRKANSLNATDRLENLKQEIQELRLRCSEEDLSSENYNDLEDLEVLIETKVESILEESGEGLVADLEEVEEEKKKLLKDFAERLNELEVKQNSIIQRIKIKANSIALDNVEANLDRVRLMLQDRFLNITAGENLIISDEELEVETEEELEYEDGELVSVKSKRKIKILPDELRNKIRSEIVETRLEDSEKLKYIAKTIRKGNLLGIFPVDLSEDVEVDAETGDVLRTHRPFWAFLVG